MTKNIYVEYFFLGSNFKWAKCSWVPSPPHLFVFVFFFGVLEYVVLEDRSSPLCVQSLPSPFLVIYKDKNLVFSIMWCKTTIAKLYEGF
jgi:hypothetical protein